MVRAECGIRVEEECNLYIFHHPTAGSVWSFKGEGLAYSAAWKVHGATSSTVQYSASPIRAWGQRV